MAVQHVEPPRAGKMRDCTADLRLESRTAVQRLHIDASRLQIGRPLPSSSRQNRDANSAPGAGRSRRPGARCLPASGSAPPGALAACVASRGAARVRRGAVFSVRQRPRSYPSCFHVGKRLDRAERERDRRRAHRHDLLRRCRCLEHRDRQAIDGGHHPEGQPRHVVQRQREKGAADEEAATT